MLTYVMMMMALVTTGMDVVRVMAKLFLIMMMIAMKKQTMVVVMVLLVVVVVAVVDHGLDKNSVGDIH